jgi:hypothetical protein
MRHRLPNSKRPKDFGNYYATSKQSLQLPRDEEFGSVAISSEDQATIDFIKGKGIVNSGMVVASI